MNINMFLNGLGLGLLNQFQDIIKKNNHLWGRVRMVAFYIGSSFGPQKVGLI